MSDLIERMRVRLDVIRGYAAIPENLPQRLADEIQLLQEAIAALSKPLPVEAIESGIRSLDAHIAQICDLNFVDTADELTGGIREGVAIIEGYITELKSLLPAPPLSNR